ncbi:MAG TPA: hypothetical protein VL137_07370 [Polyangiaceae bacterium]|jgi:hypothetical protein|nr:hypothetical protein [Polyangiaceae bacterium]
MKSLNGLAEARIREWQNERSKGRATKGDQLTTREEPLEVTLWKSWLDMHQRAKTANPAERQQLLQRCREIELQLLVLLERTGRPLAARRLAERLAAEDTDRG